MKATRDDFMKATQNVLTKPENLELVISNPEFIEPAIYFSILIANRLQGKDFDSSEYARTVDSLAEKLKNHKLTVNSYTKILALVTFGLQLYDELEDVLISRKVVKGIDR